jgi:hypothetical protein
MAAPRACCLRHLISIFLTVDAAAPVFGRRSVSTPPVEFRIDPLNVDALGQGNRAHECPIGTFQPVAAVFLATHVLLFLTAQHQCAVVDRGLQILTIHAGQFGRDAQRFAVVDDIDPGPESRRTEVAEPPVKAAYTRERIVEEFAHRAPWVA